MFLCAINQALFYSDDSFVRSNFAQEKELVDPLAAIARDNNNPRLRTHAIEVFKTLAHRAPHWLHNLLTLFISFTSIANANLAAGKQVAVYSVTPEQMKASQHSMLASLNSLNANSSVLACLFSAATSSLQGVPIALTNTALNCAKGMVLGNWQVEDEDDEVLAKLDLQSLDWKKSQRRAAGWILIDGILYLGSQWVSSRLSLIFKLFHSVFSKEMCLVDPKELQEQSYQEKVLHEFKIKKAAIQALRTFLSKCSSLLNQYTWKLVGGFLSSAVSFFVDKDKKELTSLFKRRFDIEYQEARADLFSCLLMTNASLYSSKSVHLLHSLCEVIVSDQNTQGIAHHFAN